MNRTTPQTKPTWEHVETFTPQAILESRDFAVKHGRTFTLFTYADTAYAYHQAILGSNMKVRINGQWRKF